MAADKLNVLLVAYNKKNIARSLKTKQHSHNKLTDIKNRLISQTVLYLKPIGSVLYIINILKGIFTKSRQNSQLCKILRHVKPLIYNCVKKL